MSNGIILKSHGIKFVEFCRRYGIKTCGLKKDENFHYIHATAVVDDCNGPMRLKEEVSCKLYLNADDDTVHLLFKSGRLFKNYGLTIFPLEIERFLGMELTLQVSIGGPGFFLRVE